jgi:hypothetical protein
MSYVDESEGLESVRSSKQKKRIKRLSRRLIRSSSDDTEDTPDLHRTQTKLKPNRHKIRLDNEVESGPEEELPETAGSFLEGSPLYCATWKSFDKTFSDFQEQTFQMFSCRTSTSVDARNRAIAKEQKKANRSATRGGKRTGGILLPTSWEKYSRTFLCTHAMPFNMKGAGQRQHTKAAGGHDHPLTKHQWYSFADNRRVEDSNLRQDVEDMAKADAKPRGILGYLRAKTGMYCGISVKFWCGFGMMSNTRASLQVSIRL